MTKIYTKCDGEAGKRPLKVIKCYSDSYLKLNEDKYNFYNIRCLLLQTLAMHLCKKSIQKELLSITIDIRRTFEHHVARLCQQANNKLCALSRIAPFMDQGKLIAGFNIFPKIKH